MSNPAFVPLFQLTFGLFMLCFAIVMVCGVLLFYIKHENVNAVMQHPYLQYKPFRQLPLTIRATILLDYYLRLAFPKRRFWVIVQANYLLSHVDPTQVPKNIKLLIFGFWSACWLGLIDMAALWGVLSLGQ
ncbi:MAG TPA: hypothetical protein VF445_15805 [Bordetella sp.]|uniref:hypothetical protein n=1 Tax=Bordetella sp. TaxID=28081 RepID=UPI002ED240A2